EYVLLLNPDTLVEENTFHKCLQFMDEHPDAGALGVKLIDGSGKYLPESKRGFPTPWVAFCKTFGLSSIFPKSAFFNRYYMGHLSENETAEVDVLVGCFMFMRHEALNKSGLLDEAFFMYGEDIDLSYRITQAGYKNYYFPETSIIHYKGESTKKGSLNYVRTFYQAMIIFAQKHFSGRRAGLFILMLHGAIWFRAGLALARNILQKIWLPILDAMAIYVGLVILKNFWANYFYKDPDWFKSNVLWFNFPLYILIWLGTAWLNGAYDARFDLRRLVRGLSIGTLILAAVYGFLDLDYRPSRALVLMGAVWAVLSTIGIRALAHFIIYKNFRIGRERPRNVVIVGSHSESSRVSKLLNSVVMGKNLIGYVAPEPDKTEKTSTTLDAQDPTGLVLLNHAQSGGLGNTLSEIVRIYQIEEVIFCSKDVMSQDIMHWMTMLGPTVAYKIVPEESLSIIGSSSKDEPGELYTIEIKYNIAQTVEKRNKRVSDLSLCLLFLIGLPFWLLFLKRKALVIQNWVPVFIGKKTWVGYSGDSQNQSLPTIKPGVVSHADALDNISLNERTIARLNFIYAKDWAASKDWEILWKSLL
ncbi:MAG: glycosyltransferase, partial [Saprospiraceae bacterium]|nr:glycosyltransferase [Saprospiraceae bacterium]